MTFGVTVKPAVCLFKSDKTHQMKVKGRIIIMVTFRRKQNP